MINFTEEKLERYSRNILLEDVGIEGQERILNSKVLIIGAAGSALRRHSTLQLQALEPSASPMPIRSIYRTCSGRSFTLQVILERRRSFRRRRK